MAGRIFKAKRCLDYEKSVLSERPILKVRLYNARLEEYPATVTLGVDTGFEGSILLPTDVYEFFEVGELPRSYWRSYRTLAGPVVMRVARATAIIENVSEVEVYVETPLYGVGRALLGREVLNKLTFVLNGPRRRLCVAE